MVLGSLCKCIKKGMNQDVGCMMFIKLTKIIHETHITNNITDEIISITFTCNDTIFTLLVLSRALVIMVSTNAHEHPLMW